MKRIQKFLIRVPFAGGLAVSVAQFLVVASANAQAPNLPGIANDTTVNTFVHNVLCNAVAFYMFVILIALAVVMVLVAAYKYLTSSGDSQKVHDATMTITYAAVAVAVALLAKGLPFIVGSIIITGGGGTAIDASTGCQ